MQVGERVGQRYVLEAEAGAGGMGVVYRATDLITKKPVAVKVLKSPDAMSLARFRREAEVLARLRHPRVVSYYAHGETPAGEAYIAMEWLEGESLKERLARGDMKLSEAIDVALAVADALAAAHALPIVHRDVKPANVFLVARSAANVKLLDLGVARLRGEGQTLTETGAMIGTPSYMSPEQARGVKDIDARSDLFALGCVLYCCVAHRPPFAEDDSLVTLLKLTTEEAPPLQKLVPSVPERYAKLVHWLLSPEKEDRPADAKLVMAELQAIREETPSTATPGVAPPASTEPTSSSAASATPSAKPTAKGAKWQTDATVADAPAPSDVTAQIPSDARPTAALPFADPAPGPRPARPQPTVVDPVVDKPGPQRVEATLADSRALARVERDKTWIVLLAVGALIAVAVIVLLTR